MTSRLLAAALLAAALAPALGAAEKPAPKGDVAPYYPTPMSVAARMLEIGELKPGELLYDLGSGDGRLVILAARNYHARSVGFEIDEKLVAASRAQIAELQLGKLARIEQQDLYTADLSKPDLITVYLLPRALKMLRPLLEQQARPGARIVSHDFSIPGWTPEKTVTIEEDVEVEGLPHTVYLYRRPAVAP